MKKSVTAGRREDQKLISKIKNDDDLSLIRLFDKYLPLVKSYWQKYFINGMDFDDWKQEAMIVMIRLVKRYRLCSKVNFGMFYRTGLRNRFFDLIRKQNAQKRVPNDSLSSFSAHESYYADVLKDLKATRPDNSILIDEKLKQVILNCSAFERKILLSIINHHSFKQIAETNRCSVSKVYSAFARCKSKFRSLDRIDC